MRLYHWTDMKEKLFELHSSWEGPYKAVTQINDVVYMNQRNPRSRMMAIYLDRLTSYQGAAQDERPSGGSSGSSWRINTVEN
jgi:hypothetical protein